MKKFSVLLVGTLLAMSPVPEVAARTLKAAHYLSPRHPVGLGYQTFADELKRNTNGDLTVRIFAGESLLGAKAISDGVRDGVADIGFDTLTYTPAYYPHGMLMNDLAMVGENDMAAAFAITELFALECPACLTEFERQNQVYVSGVSTGPYVLIGKGDMNSPEALRGKALRAGGPLWDRFARFAGATGVNIPTSEMYEGLSRGILNGAIYAVGGLKSHGLADVATQVVMLPLGSFRSGNLYSFNRDVWSSLTPEQRKAVFQAASAALVRTVNAYHAVDDEGVALGKEKGIEILEPSPGLQKLRREFVEQDLLEVVANAKKSLGIADAAKFVADFQRLYAKYLPLVEPIQDDPAKLADLLYNQVYAKLDPATYGVK